MNSYAENEVKWNWLDFESRLFEKFDSIKDKYNLDDRELLDYIKTWCGYDAADGYENWILDGAE